MSDAAAPRASVRTTASAAVAGAIVTAGKKLLMFSSSHRPSPISTSGYPMRRPSPAEQSETVSASPITNSRMCPGSKPTARRTPYSVVRSRTPIAIVLPRMSIMIARTMSDTMSSAEKIALAPPRNPWFIARSLIVVVWLSSSSNSLSIAALTWALRDGSSTRVTIQPILSFCRSLALSFRYDQWKKKLWRSIADCVGAS